MIHSLFSSLSKHDQECFSFAGTCRSGQPVCRPNASFWRGGVAKSWKIITPKLVHTFFGRNLKDWDKTYPLNWPVLSFYKLTGLANQFCQMESALRVQNNVNCLMARESFMGQVKVTVSPWREHESWQQCLNVGEGNPFHDKGVLKISKHFRIKKDISDFQVPDKITIVMVFREILWQEKSAIVKVELNG